MDPEKELKKVFSQTFNVPEEKISTETVQLKLQEWDSLGHLRLIMEVETAFGISFTMEEIPVLDSFGKILEKIRTKMKPNDKG
jgi:acyl carrier protein